MHAALLPAVLLVWTVLSAWAAHRTGNLFVGLPHRLLFKVAFFAVLAPVPLMDELLAKPHFDALCRQWAVVTLQVPHPEGRAVVLEPLTRQPQPDSLVPMALSRWQWRDAGSGEPVVGWTTLEARGGKLARALEGPQAAPLSFDGTCAGTEAQALAASLGLHPVIKAHPQR